MTHRLRFSSTIAFVFAFAIATPALADAPDPSVLAEAKQLYDDGSQAFSKGEYDVAVTKLQRSFDLVPSPTAELVLARALREQGKLALAATHFAACEASARDRVAKGDDRFKGTVDDASAEGTVVKQKVGAVDVTVADAKPGDVVEVDGRNLPVVDGHLATLFRDPGPLVVTYRPATGAPVSKTVTLEAGKATNVKFGEAPAVVVTPPKPTAESGGRRKWAVPAAIAAGGVTAVGAGLFIGFGLKSNSIFSELEKCAGHCPRSQYLDRAQSGATAQNVANVGLTIGAIGAAACGTFVVLALTDHPSKKPDAPKPVALEISPGGASLRGEF